MWEIIWLQNLCYSSLHLMSLCWIKEWWYILL
jgi:hypothetical protein